jgi:hypothetical protein
MTEELTTMSDREQAQPVTKGDIIRLENKMDSIISTVAILRTDVAVMQSKPEYKQPCRDFQEWRTTHNPCQQLKDHIAEHTETKQDKKVNINTWKSGFISFLFGLLSAGCIGAITYLIAIHKGN